MRILLGWLTLLAVALVGCGGQSTGTLVGLVYLGKKPLKVGTIAVYSEDGKRSAFGEIIDDHGTYLVRNAPAGKVKIAVTVPNPDQLLPPPGPKGEPADPSLSPEALAALADKAKKIVPIPAIYGDPNQSKLATTVEANQETRYDIDLTP
jgi:hypothetical protein